MYVHSFGHHSAHLYGYGSCDIADFKNVSIVGHYVKDRTKDAQFIIIRLVDWSCWRVITGFTAINFI